MIPQQSEERDAAHQVQYAAENHDQSNMIIEEDSASSPGFAWPCLYELGPRSQVPAACLRQFCVEIYLFDAVRLAGLPPR